MSVNSLIPTGVGSETQHAYVSMDAWYCHSLKFLTPTFFFAGLVLCINLDTLLL